MPAPLPPPTASGDPADRADRVPLRTIVAAVDGTPGGSRALLWAAARARELDAEILAVHVLTYTREFGRDLTPDTITNWRRRLATDLSGPWTDPARTAAAKLRTAIVEADSVADGILEATNREGADLIVLGTHGRGSVADRLLGATTYTVTHRARTPVVIVPVDWEPPATAA